MVTSEPLKGKCLISRTGQAFTIRRLEAADEVPWRQLFIRYAEFYQVAITEEALSRTWSWLTTAEGPLAGWVAVGETQLIGLAHCRTVPESLTGSCSCCLDDLFVCEAQRGRGAGEALIRAVHSQAALEGHLPLRWVTARGNDGARRLYERLAVLTDWITYEVR